MITIIKIIFQIGIFSSIYLIGSWIQSFFNLVIPGSVIGMLLMFILLMTKVMKVTWIEEGAQLIMNHLAFLFIPITVGIIDYFAVFSGKGFLLVVIGLVSTAIVMAGSGIVSQWLFSRKELKND